jgi:hypothetical protein
MLLLDLSIMPSLHELQIHQIHLNPVVAMPLADRIGNGSSFFRELKVLA